MYIKLLLQLFRFKNRNSCNNNSLIWILSDFLLFMLNKFFRLIAFRVNVMSPIPPRHSCRRKTFLTKHLFKKKSVARSSAVETTVHNKADHCILLFAVLLIATTSHFPSAQQQIFRPSFFPVGNSHSHPHPAKSCLLKTVAGGFNRKQVIAQDVVVPSSDEFEVRTPTIFVCCNRLRITIRPDVLPSRYIQRVCMYVF